MNLVNVCVLGQARIDGSDILATLMALLIRLTSPRDYITLGQQITIINELRHKSPAGQSKWSYVREFAGIYRTSGHPGLIFT